MVDWGIIASFAGIFVVVVGAVIARDRQITNMIHTNHDENVKAVDEVSKELHSRINRQREHVDGTYLKQSEHNGHASRVEKSLTDIRAEMKDERRETAKRLDAILTAVGKAG